MDGRSSHEAAGYSLDNDPHHPYGPRGIGHVARSRTGRRLPRCTAARAVDLVQWIRAVEASVIDTVREVWDLPVHRVEGRAGVWLTEEGRRDRKICALV